MWPVLAPLGAVGNRGNVGLPDPELRLPAQQFFGDLGEWQLALQIAELNSSAWLGRGSCFEGAIRHFADALTRRPAAGNCRQVTNH